MSKELPETGSMCQCARLLIETFSKPGLSDNLATIAKVLDALHATAHAYRDALVQVQGQANLLSLTDHQFRTVALAAIQAALADDLLDDCRPTTQEH